MAGEYIIASSLEEYWKTLKAFYLATYPDFQEIDQKTYESFNKSEREDSDNQQNLERLGKDTQATDITFYKYLPENITAFRTHIINIEGKELIKFYQITNQLVERA